MATSTLEKKTKTSCIDLRMEDSQKSAYEQAAHLKGKSLSQWSIDNLDAAAARDIEEARVMRLNQNDFDLFCQLLDEPAPKEFQELLKLEPAWA